MSGWQITTASIGEDLTAEILRSGHSPDFYVDLYSMEFTNGFITINTLYIHDMASAIEIAKRKYSLLTDGICGFKLQFECIEKSPGEEFYAIKFKIIEYIAQ